MAVVYRHRRADTYEVFYVGIGRSKKRAYDFVQRNRFWKFIKDKTTVLVEVVAEGLDWEQACELEQFLISSYGRRDRKEGSLVNLTEGGDGSLGAVHSSQRREQMSKKFAGANNPFYGRKHSKDFILANSKPVIQFDSNKTYIKEWESATEAEKHLSIISSNITACCRHRRSQAGGYLWAYVGEEPKLFNNLLRPVAQYSLKGEFVAEYASTSEAARKTGIPAIRQCCSGRANTAGGFKWKFINNI